MTKRPPLSPIGSATPRFATPPPAAPVATPTRTVVDGSSGSYGAAAGQWANGALPTTLLSALPARDATCVRDSAAVTAAPPFDLVAGNFRMVDFAGLSQIQLPNNRPSVGCLIVNRDPVSGRRSILLNIHFSNTAKSSIGGALELQVKAPCANVAAFESLTDALVREVLEETYFQLTADDLKKCVFVVYTHDKRSDKHNPFVRCDLLSEFNMPQKQFDQLVANLSKGARAATSIHKIFDSGSTEEVIRLIKEPTVDEAHILDCLRKLEPERGMVDYHLQARATGTVPKWSGLGENQQESFNLVNLAVNYLAVKDLPESKAGRTELLQIFELSSNGDRDAAADLATSALDNHLGTQENPGTLRQMSTHVEGAIRKIAQRQLQFPKMTPVLINVAMVRTVVHTMTEASDYIAMPADDYLAVQKKVAAIKDWYNEIEAKVKSGMVAAAAHPGTTLTSEIAQAVVKDAVHPSAGPGLDGEKATQAWEAQAADLLIKIEAAIQRSNAAQPKDKQEAMTVLSESLRDRLEVEQTKRVDRLATEIADSTKKLLKKAFSSFFQVHVGEKSWPTFAPGAATDAALLGVHLTDASPSA